ncbi:uncharacterized protein B0H64DRAFT_437737 [Chaetomium fimeti]|uniref:CFEM domain-containing protein n=1 Tax=Chaetomium fimeti TaxID=1854472 RepID=A0AAE0HQ10_9PEZI|nr:hypothetical protein B0H64DRAFT_437737 [Chaetomium fimeti]
MSGPLLVLFLPFLALHVLADVPVSFLSYPAYIEQRECIKLCLWHVGAVDDLIPAIGCSPPWVNECFCNTELAISANDFLSGCVASRCTVPKTAPAVTSALSAYNNYCSANGFSIPTVASIQSYTGYVVQPTCVQECVWSPAASSSSGDLMAAIGCGPPWDNSCLCDAGIVDAAAAFLSTCVASSCSTAPDAMEATAAMNIHNDYCSAAGLPIPIAVTATTQVARTTVASAATTSTATAVSNTSNRGYQIATTTPTISFPPSMTTGVNEQNSRGK